MKSIAVKFRKIASYTLLGIGVSFATLPTAHAQFFFGVLLFSCDLVNDSPDLSHPEAPGDTLFYASSMLTTAQPPNAEGMRRVTLKNKLTQHDRNGAVKWTRNLSVTGAPIGTVFGVPPFQDLVYFNSMLDLSGRSESPTFIHAGECRSVGDVKHGGTWYTMVGLGTTGQEDLSIPATHKDKSPVTNAATGSGTHALIKGRDKTFMNWWLLNRNTGNIVKVHKPRAKSAEYQLVGQSGVYDIDKDGNVELVIVSVKFVGENFYDFIYRAYNIVTGVLEKTTTIRQSNRQVIKP